MLALRSRVAAGTASPQTAAASWARATRSSMRSCGGLRLDEAAQAEAHVPALVALDALDALAHPGQGAVGQVVEQRVLAGVEHDSLEQHVVEADALGEPAVAGRELGGHRGQPHLEELEHRRRERSSRAAARRSAGVAPGSPSTSAAMRSKNIAWRSSSRRCRKKTQAIRLSWETSVAFRAASANGAIVLGDGLLAHAEAGEQRREAAAALGRQLRPRAGVRA